MRDKRGSTVLFALFSMLVVLTLMVAFYKIRINAQELKLKANQTNEEIEFVNNFKNSQDKLDIFISDGVNYTTEYFKGKEYTIHVKSTGKLVLKDVQDIYELDWTNTNQAMANGAYSIIAPALTGYEVSTSKNNQFFGYRGFNLNAFDYSGGETQDKKEGQSTVLSLFSSKSSMSGHPSGFQPLTGNGNLPTVLEATRARYSVDSGTFEYIDDYPNNLNVPTTYLDKNGNTQTISAGNIILMEFLDNKNKVKAWYRYVHGSNDILGTSYNRLMLTKLPNKGIPINEKYKEDIIYQDHDYLKAQTGSKLTDIFPSVSSLYVGYGYVDACVTWRSKGFGASNYGSYNSTTKKTIMNYSGSTCENNVSIAKQNDILEGVQSNKNPWINGWNTITTTEMNAVYGYWTDSRLNDMINRISGTKPTIGSDKKKFVRDNVMYCLDPTTLVEAQYQADKFIREVVKPIWDKAIQNYNSAYSAYVVYANRWNSASNLWEQQAIGPAPVAPVWDNYKPKKGQADIPVGIFDSAKYSALANGTLLDGNIIWANYGNRANYQVPCIKDYEREEILNQFESDKSLQNQITLSFINNYSSTYEVEINGKLDILRSHEVDRNAYMIRNGKYFNLATQPTIAYSGGATIPTDFSTKLYETLPKNYDSVDLGQIYKDFDTSRDRNEIRFTVENAKIENIIVKYTTIDREEFEISVTNSAGELLYQTTKVVENSM